MKKILLALGFAASLSAGIAKADSCATVNPGTAANAYFSGTTAVTNNTACLTLSCGAAISNLTPKFELVFTGAGASGPGLPGAHYANDPASTDVNQGASFQLDSTCNAKVVATITQFADSAAIPHTISTTPTVGIDSSSFVTDASTYQGTGPESQAHKIVADVELPATLAGLPAGEYDATITLTLSAQ